jgi:hypothetical protein
MGIFFKSESRLPVMTAAISDALATSPSAVSNVPQEAATRAIRVETQTSGKLSWPRLIVALIILALLLIIGIVATIYKLDDWSKMLIHSFELVLGLVIGLLGGEAAANH